MSTAFTMGRFNIPTPGHAAMITAMAADHDQVVVYLSIARGTLPYVLRTTLLYELLPEDARRRVEFRGIHDMYCAFEEMSSQHNVFYCGSDRLGNAQGIASRVGNTSVVAIQRNGISSTLVRELVDSGDMSALTDLYPPELVTQVLMLRNLELTAQ